MSSRESSDEPGTPLGFLKTDENLVVFEPTDPNLPLSSDLGVLPTGEDGANVENSDHCDR